MGRDDCKAKEKEVRRGLLVIGPSMNRDGSRRGGVTLPFEEFCAWIGKDENSEGIEITFARLVGQNTFALFMSHCAAVRAMLHAKRADAILLHLTWRSLMFLLPWLVCFSIVLRKKIILRKFAGDFDERFRRAVLPVRGVLHVLLLSVSICYFETNYLVSWARQRGYPARWWPNSRRTKPAVLRNFEADVTENPLRLIFVGTVSRAKGVDRLIHLSRFFNEEIIIDVVGPAENSETEGRLVRALGPNLYYKGALDPSEVAVLIGESAALILPSTWEGEGYPGVIIEAAMLGVPAIASPMRGPAELIGHLGAGCILAQGSDAEFQSCLKAIREFHRSDGAKALRAKARRFDSSIVFRERFREIIGFLC